MVVDTLIRIVSLLANLVFYLVLVQFVIGLLLSFNVVNRSNEFILAIYNSINALMEPVLKPIRRVLPNTGAIDFSPLALIVLLQILLIILPNLRAIG